jgi:hypothetical protein
MALNKAAWKNAMKPGLAAGLKGIYAQMHSGDTAKDDNWFADELAELIAEVVSSTGTDYIKTAGVPAGAVIVSVAGQATGTPNPAEITVR